MGSHPFTISGQLDRARRDLELFLLQHRLEPALLRRGRRAIAERGILSERLGREYFEGLYAESKDPWDFETSEYERNKYARTLAVLGEHTFREPSKRARPSGSLRVAGGPVRRSSRR